MRPITLRNPILGVDLAGYFYKTSAVTSRLGQRGDSTSRNVQINAQYCASRVQASRYIDGRWYAKRRRAKKKNYRCWIQVETRWSQRSQGHEGWSRGMVSKGVQSKGTTLFCAKCIWIERSQEGYWQIRARMSSVCSCLLQLCFSFIFDRQLRSFAQILVHTSELMLIDTPKLKVCETTRLRTYWRGKKEKGK